MRTICHADTRSLKHGRWAENIWLTVVGDFVWNSLGSTSPYNQRCYDYSCQKKKKKTYLWLFLIPAWQPKDTNCSAVVDASHRREPAFPINPQTSLIIKTFSAVLLPKYVMMPSRAQLNWHELKMSAVDLYETRWDFNLEPLRCLLTVCCTKSLN